MKDSQLKQAHKNKTSKYIKANNERFSTGKVSIVGNI